MEHIRQDIADLRVNYQQAELSEDSINKNPFNQFETWFQQALDAKLPEPNAFTLSTSTQTGRPSARVVLLKHYDEDGFVFYTNYSSQKARDLEENPLAALTFFWAELERQVRIEGRVEKVSHAESLKYFLSRPYGSQLGAWVSPQSSIITTRSLLETKWNEMKEKFKEGKVPLPDFWGGYRVVPDSIEFWQGRSNRLHDRLKFVRDHQQNWSLSRLAP